MSLIIMYVTKYTLYNILHYKTTFVNHIETFPYSISNTFFQYKL